MMLPKAYSLSVRKAILYGSIADYRIAQDIEIVQLAQALSCPPYLLMDESPEWIWKLKVILSTIAERDKRDAAKP